MLLHLAVGPRDADSAVPMLEWMRSLDGQLDYDCYLTLNQSITKQPIIDAATALFRTVTVLETDAPDAWPQGKNYVFQNFVRYLDDKRIKDCFMWLEPDGVPLKKGWLTAIEQAHVAGGKPFSGFVHPALQSMECIGVYPHNFMDYSPHNGMLCRAAPWDAVAKGEIVPNCTPLNHLMQFVNDIDGFPPSFDTKESLRLLNPDAVFFHRNKDGSLIEQLSSGKWKRWFSFSPKSNGYGVVTLRRAGDIISLLPAIKQLADERKKPVRMVVHESYAPLFDGITYAVPELWHGDWENPLEAAKEHRAVNAQVLGRGIMPDWQKGNFAKDAWKLIGKPWNRYAPLIFDRRSERREQELADRVFQSDMPKVLVKLDGFSSPFKQAAELRERITDEFTGHCELVFLDDIQAHRLYDLLGLMDRAACMVSIDTVTLHLASGTTCPVIALTNGTGFSATPPRGNCVLRVPYDSAMSRYQDIAAAIRSSLGKTTDDRMVLAYSYFEPRSEETRQRNREALSTWPLLGARMYPFVGTRDSRGVGDPYGMPFVRDMIHAAFSSGDEGIAVISNNDIRFDPKLGDDIRRSCAKWGCYWSYRVPNPGGGPDGGVDVVAMTRAWWHLHERQIPDLLFGTIHWDQVMNKVMRWSGCHDGAHLCYHTPHTGCKERKNTPGEKYNVRLATDWYAKWHEHDQR
jgi:hypothetical protein